MGDDEKTTEELVFSIPRVDVKQEKACGIDFGASVIKIAYLVPKENEIEVHCASFALSELSGALQYLKMKGRNESSTINVCGIGGYNHQKQIAETLGATVAVQNELDCFVKAFHYLFKVLPRDSLVHPKSKAVQEYAQTYTATVMRAFAPKEGPKQEPEASTDNETETEKSKGMPKNGGSVTNAVTPETENSDDKSPDDVSRGVEYPILLYMCGSGGSPILIQEDGSYRPLDLSTTCGRYFLGLGSLLTGAKSFEELVALADLGDATACDVTGKHMKEVATSDFYSKIPDMMTIFDMGQAVGKNLSDFKKEDLAASLLAALSRTLAQIFFLWAHLTKVKSGYFCGSLTSSNHVVRDAIDRQFTIRSMGKAVTGEHVMDHHFIKCGAYLGCIGSMLMPLQRDG